MNCALVKRILHYPALAAPRNWSRVGGVRLRGQELENLWMQSAIASLRMAEDQNCIQHCGAGSCLFPIAPNAVHRVGAGADQAITYLERILTEQPDHAQARWLYTLAVMVAGRSEQAHTDWLIPTTAFSESEECVRFRDIAAEREVSTQSMAGGAVFEDFDGDGDLDLFTSSFGAHAQCQLFWNDGEGGFRNGTEEAGLIGITGGLNVIQGDYDGDGFPDLLILRGAWLEQHGRHPNSLLRNNGDRTFTDMTIAAGLMSPSYPSQTAAFSDYDNDGDLDLYVGNETNAGLRAPCQLFQNQGDGTYVDVAAAAGVTNQRYTKGVVFGDYDGDRFPDLYVSNMGQKNRLYRNNRDGTFTDVAAQCGVESPILSFPTWFWDYNNDGQLDLFVASYRQDLEVFASALIEAGPVKDLPHLYRGDGAGGFVDVAQELGLQLPHIPMGANFGDINNDGFPDFYLGTGFPGFEALMPNRLFLNSAGNRFLDVTTAANVGHLQKGHAVSFADFDADGDQDLFVQLGGAYPGDQFGDALFENEGQPGHHWLVLSLVGVKSNRSAIGARVCVTVEDAGVERKIYHWIGSGGSFGANPLRCEMGLGAADRILRVEISWPTSDTRQVFTDVPMDHFLEITEFAEGFRIFAS